MNLDHLKPSAVLRRQRLTPEQRQEWRRQLGIAAATLVGFVVFVFLFRQAAVAVFAGLALYLVPTIVAIERKVPNRGSVAVINILLGWSVVGWVVALAMAARSVPSKTLAP